MHIYLLYFYRDELVFLFPIETLKKADVIALGDKFKCKQLFFKKYKLNSNYIIRNSSNTEFFLIYWSFF